MKVVPDRVDEEMATEPTMAFNVSPVPSGVFTLRVISGPDTGKSFSFDASHPTPVLAGQGPACELKLSDRQVSRRHAEFEHTEKVLRITDLGSTNGTFVNDLAVGEAFLLGGETVRLGETTIQVLRHDASAVSLPAETSFGGFVGASTEIRLLYPLLGRLAQSDVPVLIEGETGTGKEVAAEALHDQGPRSARPFVVFDCTAVPPSLLESELFGHERGAFTGATAARKGVFEQANGGTLLIDEIGDLELSLQPKLLRAIDRHEVRRVGGDRAIVVDVRILAATRRDLDREVQAHRFRDDLFHRIVVARIKLPPLRRRRGDVAVLAKHFCDELGVSQMIHPSLLRRWDDHPWPGNVRELRNAVARVLALGELGELAQLASGTPTAGRIHLPGVQFLVEDALERGTPLLEARSRLSDDFERLYIGAVLARHGGNVTRAAAAAGVARRYFQILKARDTK